MTSSNQKFEDLFYNDTIGTAAGQLYDIQNSRFNVIRLGGIISENERNKLETKEGLEIYFVGRNRTDMFIQYDTQYLNNHTVSYNTYIAPGKSTSDIGIAAAAGKNIGFEENIIILGLDIRSITTWGKPQSPEATSKAIMHEIITNTQLKNHIHTFEIPLIYLRGIDLTININKLFFNLSDQYPKQILKLGMFPFEIGRGISLGAVYKTSSELVSYMAVDSISQFAPGFLLQGDLLKNSKIHYKFYTGIIQNFSKKQKKSQGEFSNHKKYGLFNIISALQVDWKYIDNEKQRIILSPYLIAAHEGLNKSAAEMQLSTTNLMTYGIALEGEKYNEWEIAFEFAINNGSQYFFEIDNNKIIKDQYTCPIIGIKNTININTSINVLTNSDVIFAGYSNSPKSRTTNIENKNTVYLEEGSMQQNEINKIYKNSYSNNKITTINKNNYNIYTIKNSNKRFQDCYKNLYEGFMTVFDIAKYIYLWNKKCKIAFATGFASGDSISLIYNEQKNINHYNGFISLQEMYGGKMVMSAFLMNGIKNNKYGFNSSSSTQYSLLAQTSSQESSTPSPFNGFTNIMYSGFSLLIPHEGTSYIWKWCPNILVYAQPYADRIDMQTSSLEIQNTKKLSPFLGTEVNIFLELISQKINVFKIFFVGSLLFPGQYYKDFAKFNLDKTKLDYSLEYKKLQQNIIGYSFNIGIEFYF